MKQRCILSIICALMMLYYAMPKLHFEAAGLPKYFSVAWLLFAMLAIGGNLGELLFSEQKQKVVADFTQAEQKRMRSYDG